LFNFFRALLPSSVLPDYFHLVQLSQKPQSSAATHGILDYDAKAVLDASEMKVGLDASEMKFFTTSWL